MRKYQWVKMTHWFFGTLAEAFSLITEAQFLRFVFKSSKWGLTLVSRPQNEALKSGRAETLLANRQNVGKVSPDIFSLPFIRNHDFARNSTKGWIFKAFGVFSKAFYEMLKKETVNLSLKNAILCLRFGLVHFILTNLFCAESIFLWIQRRAFWGVRKPSLHLGTRAVYYIRLIKILLHSEFSLLALPVQKRNLYRRSR